VVYQAPVTIEGPVLCQEPAVCAAPTVVCLSGCGGCADDYFEDCASAGCSSTVIYFGRGESLQRGYQFTHPR